jgi:hypothetical protein
LAFSGFGCPWLNFIELCLLLNIICEFFKQRTPGGRLPDKRFSPAGLYPDIAEKLGTAWPAKIKTIIRK